MSPVTWHIHIEVTNPGYDMNTIRTFPNMKENLAPTLIEVLEKANVGDPSK